MADKFDLFVFRGFDPKTKHDPSFREQLIRRAAVVCGAEPEFAKTAPIRRTEKGKPYFEGSDIHFNISHSNDIWACLMGRAGCGLDIQYIRPCDYKKIAGRFFSCGEQLYIEKNGIEGLFDIWTRREAYGKYTGEGFFGTCPRLADAGGDLMDRIAAKEGREAVFTQLPHVASGVKCVVCSEHAAIVRIREEW